MVQETECIQHNEIHFTHKVTINACKSEIPNVERMIEQEQFEIYKF